MLTMTVWTDIIKGKLKSDYSKYKIRKLILSECLYSPNKYYGSYQVNGELVWKKVIMGDPVARENAKKLRWKDSIDVESWYEEYMYQCNRRYWYGTGFTG